MKETTKLKNYSVLEHPSNGFNMYKLSVEFENGKSGIAWARKNPPPYKPGDTVEIESKGTDNGGNMKFGVAKPKSSSEGGNYKKGGKSSYDSLGQQIGNALTNATNLVIARKEEPTLDNFLNHMRVLIKVSNVVRKSIEGGAPAQQSTEQGNTAQTQQQRDDAATAASQQPASNVDQSQVKGEVLDDDDVPF